MFPELNILEPPNSDDATGAAASDASGVELDTPNAVLPNIELPDLPLSVFGNPNEFDDAKILPPVAGPPNAGVVCVEGPKIDVSVLTVFPNTPELVSVFGVLPNTPVFVFGIPPNIPDVESAFIVLSNIPVGTADPAELKDTLEPKRLVVGVDVVDEMVVDEIVVGVQILNPWNKVLAIEVVVTVSTFVVVLDEAVFKFVIEDVNENL